MIFEPIIDQVILGILSSFVICAAFLIIFFVYRRRNAIKKSLDPLLRVKEMLLGFAVLLSLFAAAIFGMQFALLRPITLGQQGLALRGTEILFREIASVELRLGRESTLTPGMMNDNEKYLVVRTYDDNELCLSENDYPVERILEALKTKIDLKGN